MQERGVYEFYMHGHVFVLLFCVELRRNTVEIVLDFLCKKYTLGINLVYCAANSNFQCNRQYISHRHRFDCCINCLFAVFDLFTIILLVKHTYKF